MFLTLQEWGLPLARSEQEATSSLSCLIGIGIKGHCLACIWIESNPVCLW